MVIAVGTLLDTIVMVAEAVPPTVAMPTLFYGVTRYCWLVLAWNTYPGVCVNDRYQP